MEYNLPLYINFIDFKAAFDSVDRQYIWSALEHYSLPQKYIKIFQAFYSDTISAVRIGDFLTEWFEVGSGTGLGDIQAPPIFNIVLNWAMELSMEERHISQGFLLQKRRSSRHPAIHITDLDYADDIAVLDSSKDGLQEATTKISNFGREAGLCIHSKKTNTMVIDKFHNQRPFPHDEMLELTISGDPLEQVNHFR